MNIDRAAYVTGAQRMTSDITVSTDVRLYDAITTTQCNSLPRDWRGKFIELACEGGTVDYVVTIDANATVDRTVAATSAGASSSTLGARLTAGEKVQIVMPKPGDGSDVYFARQADVSTAAVRITLVGA